MPRLVRRWAFFVILAFVGLIGLNHFASVRRSRIVLETSPEKFSSTKPLDVVFTEEERRPPVPPEQIPIATPEANIDDQPDAVAIPEKTTFRWRDVPTQNPVKSMIPLPTGPAVRIPRIQHDFSKGAEDEHQRAERKRRLAAVREAFTHSWKGYSENAWLHDEVRPINGKPKDPFGGWGATLVDSLDTLWIMDLKKEFGVAVEAIKEINFNKCTMKDVNIFETTIRYLGGFLAAYDLSGNKYPALLEKAIEVAEMMYRAFDTPERMPITRWNFNNYLKNSLQSTPQLEIVAELGSLTMEFTRLSQVTGDPKWFDAVQRISDLFEREQNKTKIPGLWPLTVNPKDGIMSTDNSFTLGGMADSVFEYLPKEYLLLNGRAPQYANMHNNAVRAVKNYLVFEPLLPPYQSQELHGFTPKPPLVLGTGRVDRIMGINLDPRGEHLVCFAGGMFALAARALSHLRPAEDTAEDLDIALRLAAGCVWSYNATASGIGPEIFSHEPCRKGRDAVTGGLEQDWQKNRGDCTWDRQRWLRAIKKKPRGKPSLDALEKFAADRHLTPGFTEIGDAKYQLRPEAIESLFILYRITGDTTLQDAAWGMFSAIARRTRTDIAFAALQDVTQIPDDEGGVMAMTDGMESFWTAETLKYFYLIFAGEELVSLDEFVFNTEAHPLRWREKGTALRA